MLIIPNIMAIDKCLVGSHDCLYSALGNNEKKGVTTYTLRVKYKISGSTVQRLKKNMSVSTNTLADLCELLNCELSDVAEYRKDK